ncbi:MAG: hypothetical protein HRU13_03375 [Phycisphaerales bacterium]|nr:hypothetical protein [Phycisphaerales bacterium]
MRDRGWGQRSAGGGWAARGNTDPWHRRWRSGQPRRREQHGQQGDASGEYDHRDGPTAGAACLTAVLDGVLREAQDLGLSGTGRITVKPSRVKRCYR